MFAEFAVQPELFATWPGYCSLIGKFGIQNGRLISRFPKSWKRMVIEAAQKVAGDVELARIIESLQHVDAMMVAKGRPWNNQLDWINNAIAEHNRQPFHAILAIEDSPGNGFVLNAEAMDPANPPEAFAVKSSIRVPRTAQRMAGCIETILVKCSKICFVDPHYDPCERRFNQPLQEFLKLICTRTPGKAMPTIEYHTGNKNKALATIEAQLNRWIKPSLVQAMSLTVVRWDQNEIHNRYVITDLGAVMFGNGLDENLNKPHEKETISIVGESDRLELLEDYSPNSKAFTWLNETITITG